MDDHVQYTMTQLMQRDDPSQIHPATSSGDDIVSVHDLSSDVDMESNIWQPEQHTKDSSPDSDLEDSNHPSGDSDMESDQDSSSGYNSNSSSDHNSYPGSNPGSGAGSDSGSELDSDSSDNNQGGDLTDMFHLQGSGSTNPQKKPESQSQSGSHS